MYVLIVLLPGAAGSPGVAPAATAPGRPHASGGPVPDRGTNRAQDPAADLAARINALDAPDGSRVMDLESRRPERPSDGGRPGTELLGVYRTPESVLAAAVLALRDPGVVLSIGVGALDGHPAPEGSTEHQARTSLPRDLSGPALGHARAGVEELARLSPSRRGSAPLRVEADDAALARAATALLRLVTRLARERTDAQWRVVDLLVPGVRGQHAALAQVLGISVQAVSRTLIRAGWAEEQEGLAAAAELLRRLDATA